MIDDGILKKLTPDLFVSQAELKVRYRDLDTFNHVNNSVYPSYMEFGRLDYMHRFMKGLIDWKEKGFILGTNHIVHLKPLFLFDKVSIYTGVGKIGKASVNFISLITNGKEPVAVAYSTLVAYNFMENKTIPVPEEWRQIFFNTDKRLLDFIEKNQHGL